MNVDLAPYRCERKFTVTESSHREVEGLIKFHPAMFSEIYRQRYVNNIYFDSPDMKHYEDNVSGTEKRQKVRIRWYGDLFGGVETPVLEIKRKTGVLGSKDGYKLSAFEMGAHFSKTADSMLIADAPGVPENIKSEFK
ncbi:MAG: VTC domain-containing protein, partial [bacterium]|nr:VTC domain-containing protein [bacterium]